MVWKIGEKLFPKDTRFEQRRKLALVFLALLGIVILVAGVALFIVRISETNFQRP